MRIGIVQIARLRCNSCLDCVKFGIIFIFGGILGFIGGELELGLSVAIFVEQKDVMIQYNQLLMQVIQRSQQQKGQQQKQDEEYVEDNDKYNVLQKMPVQCAKINIDARALAFEFMKDYITQHSEEACII